MPSTINGFGTTYARRENENTSAGVCGACGKELRLASFDTHLAVSLLFVPVIKLKKLRVLDQCWSCTRHRTMPHAEWRKIVDDVIAHGEKIVADADADAVAAVLDEVRVIGDRAALERLAPALRERFTHDALVQRALGDAYARFEMTDQAKAAYQRAIDLDGNHNDTAAREALAFLHVLLVEPAKAQALLEHVWRDQVKEKRDLLMLVVEAYQTRGEHAPALALLDKFESAFPGYPGVREARELSARLAKKDKPQPVFRQRIERLRFSSVPGGVLRPKRVTTLKDGLVAAGVFGAVAAAYVALCAGVGMMRPLYVVNGTGLPYDVAVDGKTVHVESSNYVRLDAGEGQHTYAVTRPGQPPVSASFTLESTFLTRPFDNARFVLNPDRAAVLLEEHQEYSTHSDDTDYSWEVFSGDLVTQIKADFAFEPFPQTVSVSSHESSTTRTRFSIAENLAQAAGILEGKRGAAGLLANMKQRALFNPDDEEAVYALGQVDPAVPGGVADVMAFLASHLDDRPTRVELWIAYLNLAQKTALDLGAARARLEKAPDGCAAYVEAMITADEAKQADLMASALAQACPYALVGTARDDAVLGNLDAAKGWLSKAGAMPTLPSSLVQPYRAVAFAIHEPDRYIAYLAARPGNEVDAVVETMRAHYLAGDVEGARAVKVAFGKKEAARAAAGDNANRDENALAVAVAAAYGEADVARLGAALKDVKDWPGDEPLELDLVNGKLEDIDGSDVSVAYALMTAASAVRHKDPRAAAFVQRAQQAIIDDGSAETAKLLTSNVAPSLAEVRAHMPLEPSDARALFAFLAERFPAKRELHDEALRLCWGQEIPWLFVRTARAQ